MDPKIYDENGHEVRRGVLQWLAGLGPWLWGVFDRRPRIAAGFVGWLVLMATLALFGGDMDPDERAALEAQGAAALQQAAEELIGELLASGALVAPEAQPERVTAVPSAMVDEEREREITRLTRRLTSLEDALADSDRQLGDAQAVNRNLRSALAEVTENRDSAINQAVIDATALVEREYENQICFTRSAWDRRAADLVGVCANLGGTGGQ